MDPGPPSVSPIGRLSTPMRTPPSGPLPAYLAERQTLVFRWPIWHNRGSQGRPVMLDPLGGFARTRELYLTHLETRFRIRDPLVSRERRHLLETPGSLCTEPLIEPLPRYPGCGWLLHDLAGGAADDPRLPGFTPGERTAFAELALAGLIDSSPAPPGAIIPREADFDLYTHQAEMLRRGVRPGAPGIVTSGTGSGKTEAFLLPVLAMLAREATRWPAPGSAYLGRRWWQATDGSPVRTYGQLPGGRRPIQAEPNRTPFVPHRYGEAAGRPAAVRALILYPMNALVEDQLVRIRR